eukprot:tig00000219_g19527.t1
MTAFSAQTISLIGSNLSRSADEGGASDLKRRESPAPIEPPPLPPPAALPYLRLGAHVRAVRRRAPPRPAAPRGRRAGLGGAGLTRCGGAGGGAGPRGPAADAYPAHPSSTPCETWSPLASAGCVPGLELAGRQQRRGAQKKREGRGPARVLELGGKATPILNCECAPPPPPPACRPREAETEAGRLLGRAEECFEAPLEGRQQRPVASSPAPRAAAPRRPGLLSSRLPLRAPRRLGSLTLHRPRTPPSVRALGEGSACPSPPRSTSRASRPPRFHAHVLLDAQKRGAGAIQVANSGPARAEAIRGRGV